MTGLAWSADSGSTVWVVDGGSGARTAASVDTNGGGLRPRPALEVAVGILCRHPHQYLMSTRPPGKAYAGYWEFPGGKLERGESVEQALARELEEELGVLIEGAQWWCSTVVDYPHALVRLHFCWVTRWSGDLIMREGQTCAWTSLPVKLGPILPGTVPVLDWLAELGDGQTWESLAAN